MARLLSSFDLKRTICKSCLRTFRSSIQLLPTLSRNYSTSQEPSDDFLSEINFDTPRIHKPIIERYKMTVRTLQEGKTRVRVLQRDPGEVLPEDSEVLGPELPMVELLRREMRRVAYPVTIVTAYGKENDPTTWHGMTLSSFNTVAFDPVPYISLNVKFPSTTGQLILDNQVFIVNILCQHQHAANVSALFAGGPPPLPDHIKTHPPTPTPNQGSDLGSMRENNPKLNLKQEPKFRPTRGPFKDLPVYRTAYGIRLSPNITMTALSCQIRKAVQVGDHKVIIAEVMDVYSAVGDTPKERRRFHLQGARLEREMALTYRRGKYTRHRTEGSFDVSRVLEGKKLLIDDPTLDYKRMTRSSGDEINDI